MATKGQVIHKRAVAVGGSNGKGTAITYCGARNGASTNDMKKVTCQRCLSIRSGGR